MGRTYELKRRAESQQETRQRIVEAAIGLHQTIGPMATTVADVARDAGVGRVTVYRHFPDEAALAHACSGLYFERHPPPDPSAWADVGDAHERLERGLTEAYAYHRATEPMMAQVLTQAREHEAMRPYHAHWREAVDVLAAPWHLRGRQKATLRAAIAVALSFETWRTLAREHGLTDRQAVTVAARLAGAAP
jgi:AcrR family transcriptional regulator